MAEHHFNRLTPAEAERLAMLAEEAGEIVQAVGKVLRHGYDSYHPNNPRMNNRELLAKEITDFLAVVELMDGDSILPSEAELDQAVRKKRKFTHHQN